MRSKLFAAGLVAGVATILLPSTPASAYCQEPVIVIEGGGSGGCTNGCMETGKAWEAARHAVEEKTGVTAVPSYWSLFVCPM